MAEKQEITRAVLQRFLPATGAVYLGVLAASAIAEPGALSWWSLGIAAVSTVLITAGFGAVAGLLGSSLRPSIRLPHRSLVAGLAAPLGLGALSVFTQGASMPTIAVLTLAAGALAGVASLGSGVFGRIGEEPMDPDVQAELERLEAELAIGSSPEYARLEVRGIADVRAADGMLSRPVSEGATEIHKEDVKSI
jgi:hypothetical protein